MRGKGQAKTSPFSINSILKAACILLMLLLAVFFVKTKLDIADMQKQLADMEQQVEQQELENKDAELALRQDDETMERTAREKLDYAHPDERVFVDISGAN
jgi:cell division protein FtsB